jgi:hypothetical protein
VTENGANNPPRFLNTNFFAKIHILCQVFGADSYHTLPVEAIIMDRGRPGFVVSLAVSSDIFLFYLFI